MAWSSIPLLLTFAVASTAGYKCLFIGHSFFRPIATQLPELVASVAGVTHEQSEVFSGGESGTPSRLWENPQKRNETQSILDRGDIELFGMTLDTQSFEANTTQGYDLWFDYALSKNPSTVFMIGAPWIDFPRDYDTANYTANVRASLPALDGVFASLRAKYPNVTIIENPYALAVVEGRLLYEAGGIPDVGSLFGGCAEDVTGESLCGDAFFNDYKGHGGEFLQKLAALVWLNRIYNVDLSAYNSSALSNFTTNMPAVAKAVLDAYDADNLCGTSTCSTCNVTTPCGVPPVIEPTGCPGDCHVYVTITVNKTMNDVLPPLESLCGWIAQAGGLEASAATCTVRVGDDPGSGDDQGSGGDDPWAVFVDATLATFIPRSGQTVENVINKLNRAFKPRRLPDWVLDVTVDAALPPPPPPPPPCADTKKVCKPERCKIYSPPKLLKCAKTCGMCNPLSPSAPPPPKANCQVFAHDHQCRIKTDKCNPPNSMEKCKKKCKKEDRKKTKRCQKICCELGLPV